MASLAEFGAFVDLGGVQGLIPASEISHSRVGRPADRLHVGEIVTVKVLKIDEAKGRISLSLKALETDPWTEIAGKLRDRQIVRGRVARMTDFGVFVELLPGIDGLLHLTEIPRSRHGEMKKAAETGWQREWGAVGDLHLAPPAHLAHQVEQEQHLVVALAQRLGRAPRAEVGRDDRVYLERRGEQRLHDRKLVVRLVLGIRIDDHARSALGRKQDLHRSLLSPGTGAARALPGYTAPRCWGR